MIVSIIVAVAQNQVMGIHKKLPWHLPADMKYFKEKTTGHHVVMGRITYEALKKPLQGRTNMVITRQKNFVAEKCIIVHDLEPALKYASENHESECFIIGGAEIFKIAMEKTHRIYLTRIFHAFEGDTFFPEIDHSEWKVVREEPHEPDSKNNYRYSFLTYERSA